MISNIQMLQAFSAQLTDMQKLADRLIANLDPKAKKAARPKKLKWVLNDETYRIALKLADGRMLQVKSVTDGAGECHDDGCRCTPCAELRMVPPAPWRTRRPLKKTYFPDEFTWLKSLPQETGLRIVEY